MLSDEEKKRIEAEEAYRASLRQPAAEIPIRSAMKREAGSLLFKVIGLIVVLVVGLAGCALITATGHR